ncbi:ParB/RepB/Spo0J family partition protein [Streptomyces albireticuli]|uniref:ParB-like N-terminal domain-containing protein n=1 Tax=Streptomyces albireticuli TaxID=1940 RepID=A0A2A2DD43_9ACTN|nr:ParB/RepB/Spo0J family partition protein [Streptomyces albireticuli]MCD9146044.1 ParB/RepB/Spo0J family partition protein [Streptomyces albireticuli]MCD9166213.1 ParB/RepB/Spo0J family partition protein [Streptomyces albireticuli]MCD9196534.1 ParB/RepB/Spo0J family partition protein [Streptomyces albireticuli]PAU50398.1 hypothetical protein CK936_02755 [Streptomyces albireticuli]
MTPPAQRITRGFSIDEEGGEAKSTPRRVRTRDQIRNGEGKRPPTAVPLAELAHNPFNPREELTDVEEAAGSLRERGQIQPVAVVRRAAFLAVHADQESAIGGAEYVVIDGNRRLAAAHVAGLTELRIDVNDSLAASAADMLESALIANVHRVDVPPIDQAKAIQQLVSVHGTQGKVAKRLGKTEGWVSQRLALLKLPQDLQEKVETGELKVRDGRRIGRLPVEQQHAEAERALSEATATPKSRTRTKKSEITDAAPEFPLPAQIGGQNGTPPASTQQDLYPVKTDEIPVDVQLPWDDPQWFNTQLRDHMSAKHREELALLLMADS